MSSTSSERQKLLCVDGSGFEREFGLKTKRWNIAVLEENVCAFVKAAEKSCFSLVLFFSPERRFSMDRIEWRAIVERKIAAEDPDCAPSVNALAGSMFSVRGVPVYYTTGVDHCDAIASYANAHRGSILSPSSTFFAFEKLACKIYGSFSISNYGDLVLSERTVDQLKSFQKKAREIPSIDTVMSRVVTKFVNFQSVITEHVFERGVASHVSRRQELHGLLEDLRRAVYRKVFKIPSTIRVREIYPDFETGQRPSWSDVGVYPTHEFDDCFQMSVEKLCEHVVRNVQEFSPIMARLASHPNHKTALRILVCELYAAFHEIELAVVIAPFVASERASEWTELDMEPFDRECKNYKKSACQKGWRCVNVSGHQECPRGSNCRCDRRDCIYLHRPRFFVKINRNNPTTKNVKRKNYQCPGRNYASHVQRQRLIRDRRERNGARRFVGQATRKQLYL